MPMAIILTDPVGRILHANSAAEELLDGCPLLCLEDALAARDGRSDAALGAAIEKAANSRIGSHGRRKVTSLIVTGPGSPAIAVWVMPIDERVGLPAVAGDSPRVAVFATAVETAARNASARDTPGSLTADTVSRRHRTSVAESRLLALLAETLAKAERPLPTPAAAAVALSH
jgi:hypothetical protein